MSGYMLKMSRSLAQQAVASFFSQLELILLIIVTISRDLFMCTSLLSVPSKYSSSSLSSTYCDVESTYNRSQLQIWITKSKSPYLQDCRVREMSQ
jgi:hypothetical protein